MPLQIFTGDLPEIEGLPRGKVLAHIEVNAPDLVIRYLVSNKKLRSELIRSEMVLLDYDLSSHSSFLNNFRRAGGSRKS